jgi:hypothetical protein
MANITWTYNGFGYFAVASDWSSGTVPGPSDDAFIGLPNAIVESGYNETVNSIGTGSSAQLWIANNSKLIANNGTGNNVSLGTINVFDGSGLWVGAGTFYNGGTIILNSTGHYTNFGVDNVVYLDGGGTIEMSPNNGQYGDNGILGESQLSQINNVNNDIAGNGFIGYTYFDNQANGILETNSNLGAGTLRILGYGGFQNEGHIFADDGGTLRFGIATTSQTIFNFGNIYENAASYQTYLEFAGDLTLKGGGNVTLSNSFNNNIQSDGSPATLDNVDNTFSGTGKLYDINLTLLNETQGVFDADNPGASLLLYTGTNTITNQGLLEAVNGGKLILDSAVDNSGSLQANGGIVDVNAALSGSGSFVIANGEADLLSGAYAGNVPITFQGAGGILRVDDKNMPGGVIGGFVPGDTVDLAAVGFDISGSIQLKAGNVLEVKESGQTYDLNFDPSQNFAGWDFKLSSDGKSGTDIRLGGQRDDFNFDRTSDILFRNDATGDIRFEAMSNGAFAGWHEVGPSSSFYSAVGVGDFYGTGTSDLLLRNNSTGDTWFEVPPNGAFHDIGGSDSHYSVVGVADFYGNGTDDILFRNNSTGDTWFEAMSNGVAAGWHQVGGSNTSYAVAGVADFYGNGTDDILFRNNSTGDTWFEAMSNGSSNGWHQIGGSDTHYSVVGVGDFFGNGTDDILFRNNSTGDTWFEAISSGAFAGWHQVGSSDTNYAVVGVGDYFGNGTDDILFRNNATGDTWFAAMSNGSFNGWHQIGGSNTSYTVKT